MSNEERREVVAIVRTYEKDGEKKNVYSTVGTAWVSEHGSKISLQLDTIPVSPEWTGRLFVNKPYEKKSNKELTHDFNKQTRDVAPENIDDNPISLDDIPF